MPPDIYVRNDHITALDRYASLAFDTKLQANKRQQSYEYAAIACAVIEKMGPTIDGLILLNTSTKQLAEIVNKDLQNLVSVPSLEKSLRAVLKYMKIPHIRGYSPHGSRNILIK